MTATTTPSEHLARTLAAMSAAGVDALVLGRSANVRFVSGAEQLAIAGTRPFAPACVVVRATGAVHLMTTTDVGIPADVPPDRLYGMSWNPMTIMGNVAAVPGLTDAATVGVDGMTPLMEALLGGTLPRATLVDGEALLRAVRRPKSAADLHGIRRAVDAAQAGLAEVVEAAAAGTRECDLLGRFEAALGRLGITTPAFDAVTCVAGTGLRVLADERPLRAGDLVHLRCGVLVDGWEGVLARTRVVGPATGPQQGAATRAAAALGATVGACTPGAAIGALRHGPGVVTLEGVGLGHEELADDDRLAVDDVVFVEVLVDQVLLGDTVHVTDAGPVGLTTAPVDLD
jgi:Xaa-Pro aminopeptidase